MTPERQQEIAVKYHDLLSAVHLIASALAAEVHHD